MRRNRGIVTRDGEIDDEIAAVDYAVAWLLAVAVYDFSQIDYERRSGYDYHGTWPAALIGTEYPAWSARHRSPKPARP